MDFEGKKNVKSRNQATKDSVTFWGAIWNLRAHHVKRILLLCKQQVLSWETVWQYREVRESITGRMQCTPSWEKYYLYLESMKDYICILVWNDQWQSEYRESKHKNKIGISARGMCLSSITVKIQWPQQLL